MSPASRKLSLGAAFALTVVAALAISREEDAPAVAEPVARKGTAVGSAASEKTDPVGHPVRLAELKRPSMGVPDANPFAPKSWYVPPPPPSAQDVKPVAPPLPFAYKGKLGEDDGRQLYYLAKGEESFVVSVGDTFAGSYKLESAREGVLVIRYLPLSITQTLRYGPDS